jgi:hypothetical protein
MSFEGFLFCAGLVIGGLVGLIVSADVTRSEILAHACGECDHVGECGDYECRPGVDGWQLKAGAR